MGLGLGEVVRYFFFLGLNASNRVFAPLESCGVVVPYCLVISVNTTWSVLEYKNG